MEEVKQLTIKEIEKRIRSEKNRLVYRSQQIDKMKSDIKATRKALAFWEGELARAKREGRK